MRSSLLASVAAFIVFVAVRVVALSNALGLSLFPVYVDGWLHYAPAGAAYVHGASVASVNPEHPPLAKYLIGFSVVYLGNALYAPLAASFLSAVVAFFLARKLTSSSMWATVTVWLLSFDMVTVGVSITPLLEPFMIFFGLLGLWTVLKAMKLWQIAIAGGVLGFAVASKWTGVFFLIPAVILLVYERRYVFAAVILATAFLAYLIPYLPYISTQGFGAFIQLQIWMGQFLYGAHGDISGKQRILVNLIAPFLFHTTTFAPVVGWYYEWLHPEGFHFLGIGFISHSTEITPFIFVLLIPALYFGIKRCRVDRDRTRMLLLLTIISLLVFEIVGADYISQWYFAPIISILAISASDPLRMRGKIFVMGYVALVAIWPLVANVIHLSFVIHYLAS
jgi:hypothetical protein